MTRSVVELILIQTSPLADAQEGPYIDLEALDNIASLGVSTFFGIMFNSGR